MLVFLKFPIIVHSIFSFLFWEEEYFFSQYLYIFMETSFFDFYICCVVLFCFFSWYFSIYLCSGIFSNCISLFHTGISSFTVLLQCVSISFALSTRTENIFIYFLSFLLKILLPQKNSSTFHKACI